MAQLFFARVLAAVFFVARDEDFLARVLAAVFFVAAVLVFLAVVFLAGVLLASVFAAVFFVAGEEDFLARVLAAVFLVAVRLVVAFFDAVFLAGVDFFAAAAFVAGAVDVALATVEAATLGSFFAPETTAFKSAPARNFGTAVFFARVRSPVRGFRTIREGRMALSKAPKPVMATFSPFATSRVIVSRTDSRAC